LLPGPALVRAACGLALGTFAFRHRVAVVVQRLRAFHHAAGVDFYGVGLVPGAAGVGRARTDGRTGPLAGSGRRGGPAGRSWRTDPLRLRLADPSRPAVLASF